MNLKEYRIFFLVIVSILVLLAAFPSLSLVITFPGGGEGFSELWILGPGHMAEDYPSEVKEGSNYTVYVGVKNHMESSNYYSVRVKFRNQSETPPQIQPEEDGGEGIPSPLPTLYEHQVFLEDGEEWETSLNFSFSGFSCNEKRCRVDNLRINCFSFPVDKPGCWNAAYDGFYYQIFVELWIYNVTSQNFEFHNRFVTRWLNMTTA